MDIPPVQYARTSDGVNIAYTVAGNGRPCVEVPGLVSHLQASLAVRPLRGFYEQLAMRHHLIRLDGRGHGMSARDVADLSLDARVRDLEAVTEQLGLEQVVLEGPGSACGCAAGTGRQAVAGNDFEFVDQGEVVLKGFDEPVRTWSVRWA